VVAKDWWAVTSCVDPLAYYENFKTNETSILQSVRSLHLKGGRWGWSRLLHVDCERGESQQLRVEGRGYNLEMPHGGYEGICLAAPLVEGQSLLSVVDKGLGRVRNPC
jgi:hypothetical protein